MGYVCGQCNIDFPTKKKIVEHMVDVHRSPFLEGDDEMKRHSKNHAIKNKDQEIIDKIAENEVA